jgi:imidazolonepropionase
MVAELIIHHIGQLISPFHLPPVKGRQMNEVKQIKDAFIAIAEGYILACGSGDFHPYCGKKTKLYDAGGGLALPGFIDSHTHLVFGGSREHEFADKVAGVPYLEILKRGGGIFSTVAQTRAMSKEALIAKAVKSLEIMLGFGVTTAEAKSGYGLDFETEIKQLEVLRNLNQIQPIELLPTYLGAHAIPKEYQGNTAAYIDQMIESMKVIKSRDLAIFTDVFCEEGVYTPAEARRILNAANEIGLIPKIHADEIVSTGGAGIAVEVNASSADHLMAIREEDINRLARSNTVANLLPGTSFFLDKPYANARHLIDSGVAIALASDYNPGSSPSENFQFIMQLAAGKLRMSPPEILNAVTINPAFELRIADSVGSIEPGKKADVVILDADNLEYVLYHYGINHTKAVFKKGVLVFENGRMIRGGNL